MDSDEDEPPQLVQAGTGGFMVLSGDHDADSKDLPKVPITIITGLHLSRTLSNFEVDDGQAT